VGVISLKEIGDFIHVQPNSGELYLVIKVFELFIPITLGFWMEEIGIMNFTWPDVTQKIIPVLNFYKYVFFSAFVV